MTSLAERLAEHSEAVGVVTNSMELSRILKLPRRVLDHDAFEDVTPILQKEGGTMRFWPLQSAALIEACVADGLFAPLPVGSGKTLITLALPTAMNSEKAVLLVPPALKKKTLKEIDAIYSKHFDLPLDRLTIVAYSELSSAKHATILEDIAPDLIICDEAHALRHKSSARTKRFCRYMKNHPECRCAFLSGTMTTRSITEYAHLLEFALRKNSPLPRGYRELRDWAGALDVSPDYIMQPGALRKLCDAPSETVRQGFQRRLMETPGVVGAPAGWEGARASLVVRQLTPQAPTAVRGALATVRRTWTYGDEEYESAIALVNVLRQLSCGFYYHWVWPDGEPDELWLQARAEWNREVRYKLQQSLPGLDSPLLLAQAAERYWQWLKDGRPKPRPELAWDSAYWGAWRIQRKKPVPPTEAVWLDSFLVKHALSWASKAKKGEPSIIWYSHKALGERIAKEGGFPHYGAGADATDSLFAIDDAQVIVCSIDAQGTGKNLQHFCRNLFTTMPPNGTRFEQAVGRTHRPGQLADVVTVDWYGHTPETETALASVIEDAKYMQETTGQPQKILYADLL